jgi:glucosylceramidase
MKLKGITIDAITPQNEPLNPNNNPSLVMTDLQQLDFIKNHLGPIFKKENIETKIVVYDHNCNKPEYPLTILSDKEANAFIDGTAFHLYEGTIDALNKVHDSFPDKAVYFTEQYTSKDGSFEGDFQWHIKNVIIGSMRNWSKNALEWNLANNSNFGPNTIGGCTTCKGALTIDGDVIQRNVGYYIVAHASKFIPTGSVRISSNTINNLQNVAFKTPKGAKILIVLNEGKTTEIFNIKINKKWITATLDSGSAATFVIN